MSILHDRLTMLSDELKRRFGCKVYKVSVDGGFSCPNRDGTKGEGGCLYCDEAGSRANYCNPESSIPNQVSEGIALMRKKYRAKKFIAYFQPFSNTYAPPENLKNAYDQAVRHQDIVGLAIGTRPDCIDREKLQLIKTYQDSGLEVWIEYGLQSACDRSLNLLNRSHTVSDFVDAVLLTRQFKIPVCAHIILGIPDESREEMLQSAHLLNQLAVWGVKIHALYLVEDSPLAKYWQTQQFRLLTKEAYIDLLIDYLELLSPQIIIHRLTGDARSDRLIAPQWLADKRSVLSDLAKRIRERDAFQGRIFRDC